jgi:integrase
MKKGSTRVAPFFLGERVMSRKAESSGRAKRVKTRYAGVYMRKIIDKRTGKADTAFDITYKLLGGKKAWDFIGYASDGVTASHANARRGAIVDGLKKGEKPRVEKKEREKKASSERMTFEEAWKLFEEKWLPNVSNPDHDRGIYNRYIHKHFGNMSISEITLLDLEEHKTNLLNKGLSASTTGLALGLIRRIYRKLAVWGMYSGSIPTEHLSLPKKDNARTRFLTQAEAIRLLDALRKRSETWYKIAYLSLSTGMRKGEVLNLKGEHIDFGANSILVKDAKTGSRIVYITNEVQQMLQQLYPDKPEKYIFYQKGSDGDKQVSIDSDESFVRAVKDCGFNDSITDRRHKVVFHSLRHSYCSWLAIAGVPLFTIGEIVGHKSTEMTKRYSHLCPDAKQAAAAQVAKMLAVASKKHDRKNEPPSNSRLHDIARGLGVELDLEKSLKERFAVQDKIAALAATQAL